MIKKRKHNRSNKIILLVYQKSYIKIFKSNSLLKTHTTHSSEKNRKNVLYQ